jgi:hypothetical protein
VMASVLEGVDRLGWTSTDVDAGLALVKASQGLTVTRCVLFPLCAGAVIWVWCPQGFGGKRLEATPADIGALESARHYYKYAYAVFGWIQEAYENPCTCTCRIGWSCLRHTCSNCGSNRVTGDVCGCCNEVRRSDL